MPAAHNGQDPWFPMHAYDRLADVATLTIPERAIYLTAMLLRWTRPDVTAEAIAVAMSPSPSIEQVEKVLPLLGWMEDVRSERIAYRAEQRRKAHLGSDARWHASGIFRACPNDASPSPSPSPSQNKARVRGPGKPSALVRPDDVSEEVWGDYLTLRAGKRAKVTLTGLSRLRAEAGRAGVSLEEAMRTCCANGWQGFRADWVAAAGRNGTAKAVAHSPNMPLGTPSCLCEACVKVRATK